MAARHIGLVTTDEEVLNGEDVDRPALLRALRARGLEADDPKWHDVSIAWDSYDLLVMRSPWDYPKRTDEFLEWLFHVREIVPVLNCPDLIKWNLDKHYLAELSASGVPCVASHFCKSQSDVRDAIYSLGEAEVVVKPTVSMGSRDTGRFSAADKNAMALAERILAEGRTVLIQPFVDNPAAIDEHSLVFFDGAFSHALAKSQILDPYGGYAGGQYTEHLEAATATPGELAVASSAFLAIAQIVKRHGCVCENPIPLYGRVDIVTDATLQPLLLEAELFEPSYFVDTSPGAEELFADAVVRRLA